MNITTAKELARHAGHNIVMSGYIKKSDMDELVAISLECETCAEVLECHDAYPSQDDGIDVDEELEQFDNFKRHYGHRFECTVEDANYFDKAVIVKCTKCNEPIITWYMGKKQLTIDDVLPSIQTILNHLADEDSNFQMNVRNDFDEQEAEDIIKRVGDGNYDIPEDADHVWIQRCKLADWYNQYTTKRERDLPTLWIEMGEQPFEEVDSMLVLEEDFYIWSKGTTRDEIWQWFDALYPGGVVALLHSQSSIKENKLKLYGVEYQVLDIDGLVCDQNEEYAWANSEQEAEQMVREENSYIPTNDMVGVKVTELTQEHGIVKAAFIGKKQEEERPSQIEFNLQLKKEWSRKRSSDEHMVELFMFDEHTGLWTPKRDNPGDNWYTVPGMYFPVWEGREYKGCFIEDEFYPNKEEKK